MDIVNKRKSRILMVMTPVKYGGGESLIVQLESELSKINVDLKILNLSISDEFEKILREKSINFLNVFNSSLGFTPTKKDYIIHLLKLIPNLLNNKLLHSELRQADIIHVHGFPANVAIFLLRNIFSIYKPMIYTHHSIKKEMKGIGRRLYSKILECYDFIVGVSSKTSYSLCKVFPELSNKIVTINNGINLRNFEIELSKVQLRENLNLPKKDLLGIYVARFVSSKNHLFLIDLLRNVNLDNFKLVLIGDGDEKQKVIEYAKSKSVIHKVIFTGYVHQSKISHYLKACDLYLHPSKFEGFGLSIIEAMAAGLPVVIFNDIYLDEFEKGVLVANNENEYINLTEKILRDQSLRTTLGNLNKLHSREFDISITAQKYFELYKRVTT